MFQEKRIVAINFSDYSIEALELQHVREGLRIRGQSRILLETGILEDGKIIDADRLRESLQKLFAQATPEAFTPREVVITIPESRVFVQKLSLPKSIARKQIINGLCTEAASVLPVDIRQMAVDYQELRIFGDRREYLFAATYGALLDEYVALFQKMQIKVVLATMESLALGAAVIDEKKDETVLVLDIGARTTIASIFFQGVLQESININIAGNAITAALAEKLHVSVAEAEQRKIEHGMKAQNGTGDGSELLIIQGQVQPLKDELLVFIKYFERATGSTIARIVLAGGSAGLAGLDEYFSANIGLPTTVAMPSPAFELGAEKQWYLPNFLVSLGLGRLAMQESSRSINFLTHREKDWVPQGSKILAKKEMQAIPAAAGQAPRVARRTIVLAAALIVILNIFGWLAWWKYGPSSAGTPRSMLSGEDIADAFQSTLQVVIRPFTGSGDGGEERVAFSFALALSDGAKTATTTSSIMRGSKESIQIDKVVPFDESALEYVRTKLRAGSPEAADFSEEAVRNELKNYLADRLWDEQYAFYRSEKEKEGAHLLASYLDKTITAAEATAADANQPTLDQMRLQVVYTGLLVTDARAFDELEAAAMAVLQNNDTTARVVTRKAYTYESLAGDLIRVVASYSTK